MALKDVKEYYNTMARQVVELKSDLADFETAFKKGYITEDKLDDIKAETAKIEENFNRLTYIMYLFEIPNRDEKRLKSNRTNKKLIEHLKPYSKEEVELENKSLLTDIRRQLKELTRKTD